MTSLSSSSAADHNQNPTTPDGTVGADALPQPTQMRDATNAEAAEPAPPVSASLSADVSEQWSWASSSARIPQISSLAVTVSDGLRASKVRITLRDSDETFGSTEFDRAIEVGSTDFGSVHVPLSARAMSRVDERRAAECIVELEDTATGRVLARLVRAVDIHPRDLWYWNGDPRRAEGGAREGQSARGALLARALLASFVRPNHPEIGVLAREAAELLSGEASFYAFQLDDSAEVEAKVWPRSVPSTTLSVLETSRIRNPPQVGTIEQPASAFETMELSLGVA